MSGWDQVLVGAPGWNTLLAFVRPAVLVAPCSDLDLIPPGADPPWHSAPIYMVQKCNQPSAGAAGGREREPRRPRARTAIPRVGRGIRGFTGFTCTQYYGGP